MMRKFGRRTHALPPFYPFMPLFFPTFPLPRRGGREIRDNWLGKRHDMSYSFPFLLLSLRESGGRANNTENCAIWVTVMVFQVEKPRKVS